MAGLNHAITGLEQALARPRRHQMWRWLVQHRLAGVRDALAAEGDHAADAWLTPRQSTLARERAGLLLKLAQISGQVLDSPDVDRLRTELERLVPELHRHRQRLNDLVYDTVALELGGSE